MFDFDDLGFSKTAIKSAILAAPYIQSGTRTGNAMMQTYMRVLSVPTFNGGTTGSRLGTVPQVCPNSECFEINRQILNNTQIMIVVTDGNSQETGTEVADAATLIRSQGIETFAFGVGTEIGVNELNMIGGLPYAEHVYSLSTFNQLSTFVNSIVQRLNCKGPVQGETGAPGSYH